MEQRKQKLLQVNIWAVLILAAAVTATCLVVFHEYVFGNRIMAFFDAGSDTIQQYVPQYASIVNMLRNGTFSLWNSSEGFGVNMFLLNMTNPALVVLYICSYFFGTEQMLYMLVYLYIGEILLAGPSVMKGYLNDEEESKKVLEDHADGGHWIRTGDIGSMDDEGYLYFKGRIKRMIISSGYNVYPAQIENILENHPYVHQACVIGVPDSYRMQAVKAYVVLEPEIPTSAQTKSNLMDYCRKNIAKYAMPKDIVFKHSLPKTLVGKIAYRTLEDEHAEETKAAAENKAQAENAAE